MGVARSNAGWTAGDPMWDRREFNTCGGMCLRVCQALFSPRLGFLICVCVCVKHFLTRTSPYLRSFMKGCTQVVTFSVASDHSLHDGQREVFARLESSWVFVLSQPAHKMRVYSVSC